MSKNALPTQQEDFSKWYTEVILKAGLAEYSAVKGCMVIKPYGYALWENIQKQLDTRIKDAGVQNAYFPLFIPKSFIDREADHVEGFAPELATITHVGDTKLDEPLVVRPTSETIMYDTFKDWIHSYRDLPLLINQWANVVRMEKRTSLFLRTTEFLWQEGHTCHATSQEAEDETLRAVHMYDEFATTCLAIPGYVGRKSESEKFAGAVYTTTIEALSKDGKAIQAGTSHFLGQNFAKSIGIQFQNTENNFEPVWQTSWGVSTRLIGALVVIHGDDKGLRLPPAVAPYQVVIVPIHRTEEEREAVMEKVVEMKAVLKDIRVHVDMRDHLSPGAKFFEWELKGAPVRIEIGPKDVAIDQCVVARRDNGEKTPVSLNDIATYVPTLLERIQDQLYTEAKVYRDEHTFTVNSYDEFKQHIEQQDGFVSAHWCENMECEAIIKEETKATTRCRPFDMKDEEGKCVRCDNPSHRRMLFAKSY